DDMTPYVGMEHMTPRTPRIGTFGEAGSITSQVSRFQVGDTLFGRLRAYLRKVALAECSGVCSPEILVLRAKPEMVLPEYLYLLASSDMAIDHAVALSAGSRMPRTAAEDLA